MLSTLTRPTIREYRALPREVAHWNEEHVKVFVLVRFSDESTEDSSLCNLLTYGRGHSGCNSVLSALEKRLQERVGKQGVCMLTPDDCRHLTPMINDLLEECRQKSGVRPMTSIKNSQKALVGA